MKKKKKKKKKKKQGEICVSWYENFRILIKTKPATEIITCRYLDSHNVWNCFHEKPSRSTGRNYSREQYEKKNKKKGNPIIPAC